MQIKEIAIWALLMFALTINLQTAGAFNKLPRPKKPVVTIESVEVVNGAFDQEVLNRLTKQGK